VTHPTQRNANARGLVGRAVLCTPLNAAAKSDIVRWSDSATDAVALQGDGVSATDPRSRHYSATSAVALQLKNTQNPA